MATKTIQERTKAAVATASSAPSMVPDALIPAPPQKEEEVIPAVSDLVRDKKDLLLIRRLMTAHIEHSAIEKHHKKEKEKVTLQLKKLAGKYGIGKADYDGDRLLYYGGTRSSIKGNLLLANGIQPSVIAACTETTTVYTLKVTVGKDDDGGEE